jgi:ERF superfamily
MNQSESIADLAAALSKAQASITGALKDSANPFFKSKYADLASCWDACRKPLTDNGLAVIQTIEAGEGRAVLVTTLAHLGGEWIKSYCPILTKDDSPQALGSAITYARRYALAAMVGLAQIDDDAEAAQGRHKVSAPQNPELLAKIAATATAEELSKLYNAVPQDVREAHIEVFKARKKALA